MALPSSSSSSTPSSTPLPSPSPSPPTLSPRHMPLSLASPASAPVSLSGTTDVDDDTSHLFVEMDPLDKHTTDAKTPLHPEGGSPVKSTAGTPPPLPPLSVTATIMLIVFNIAFSVAIVLLNKSVLVTFPYPIALTLCHQAFSWAAARAMVLTNWVAVPQAGSVSSVEAFKVGASTVFGLFLMNASLQYNSVSVYQLSKMIMLPVIAALQWLLFGAVVASRLTGLVLAVIVVSVGMATVESFVAYPFGLLVASAAVFATALSQVMLQYFPSFQRLSGMQSVAVLAPYNTCVLFLLFLLVDLPHMAYSPFGVFGSLGGAPWLNVFGTCVLAVGANYYGNSLIMRTSALTYNVVGHLKTILILVAGYLSFSVAKHDQLTVTKLIGIVLSLGAMALYMRLQLALAKQNKTAYHKHIKDYDAADAQSRPRYQKVKTLLTNSAVLTLVRVVGFVACLVGVFFFGRHAGTKSTLQALERQAAADQLAKDIHTSNPNIATWTAAIWQSFAIAKPDGDDASLLSNVMTWDRRTEQPLSDVFKRQGERVLIMSADSRPLQRLEDMEEQDPSKLDAQTMSAVYNSWWAMRHGYDYRRVAISSPPGFHGTWAKIKAIYDALFRYDLVVFLDGDAFVTDPSMSLTRIMDDLGFHKSASLLLAQEGPGQRYPNVNGTNTGFVLARSTKVAKTSLQWMMYCGFGLMPPNYKSAPFAKDASEMANCKKWQRDWAHEQTVFNMYIRPFLNEGEELIVGACTLANGWWADPNCKGQLVTHAWFGKHVVAGRMRDIMARELVRLHQALLKTSYHVSQCDPWAPGQDTERCNFLEDVEPPRASDEVA